VIRRLITSRGRLRRAEENIVVKSLSGKSVATVKKFHNRMILHQNYQIPLRKKLSHKWMRHRLGGAPKIAKEVASLKNEKKRSERRRRSTTPEREPATKGPQASASEFEANFKKFKDRTWEKLKKAKGKSRSKRAEKRNSPSDCIDLHEIQIAFDNAQRQVKTHQKVSHNMLLYVRGEKVQLEDGREGTVYQNCYRYDKPFKVQVQITKTKGAVCIGPIKWIDVIVPKGVTPYRYIYTKPFKFYNAYEHNKDAPNGPDWKVRKYYVGNGILGEADPNYYVYRTKHID